jgi:hypothetical protein
MKEHWFGPDGIFGTHPTRLRLTDEERAKNAEPLPPVTVETPQRFTDVEQIHPGSVFRPDPNFLADSPMSENVEDRRSYVGDNSNEKALSANTARLAELNGFVGRDATWPSGHGVASSTASPAVRPQPALALPVPWVGCSAHQPAARRPGASDGLFGPLRSPMPGGLRQPGAFGRDEPEGPAPSGQRPHDQFLPGSSPFGPSNTPNQFRPGPGSKIEMPAGQREANQAPRNFVQPGAAGTSAAALDDAMGALEGKHERRDKSTASIAAVFRHQRNLISFAFH